jgi:hypothetical protein
MLVPENFFNFEYAQDIWRKVQTRQELDDFYGSECPNGEGKIGDIYDAWAIELKRNPQKVLAQLDALPNSAGLKQCHDLVMTNQQWMNVYNAWRSGLSVYGGKGWNQNTRAIDCMAISATNIFTNKCNDMPDWRHPKSVVRDAENIVKGNARWVKNSK